MRIISPSPGPCPSASRSRLRGFAVCPMDSAESRPRRSRLLSGWSASTRGSCVLGLSLALTWMGAVPCAHAGQEPGSDPSEQAALSVSRLRGDLLSVSARNAPWEAVLREIEHATGLTIDVKGPLTGTVTAEVDALSLPTALRKLLPDADLLFAYASPESESRAGERLLRVWVFSKGGAGTMEAGPSPTPRAPLAAVAEGVAAEEADRAKRLAGLWALAEQGNTAALQNALTDSDATVRAAAAELLLQRDLPGTVAFLVDMTRSDDPTLRLEAVSILYSRKLADPTVPPESVVEGHQGVVLQGQGTPAPAVGPEAPVSGPVPGKGRDR